MLPTINSQSQRYAKEQRRQRIQCCANFHGKHGGKVIQMQRDKRNRQRENNSRAQTKEPDRKRKRLDREKERAPEKVSEEKECVQSPVSQSNKQRRLRPIVQY